MSAQPLIPCQCDNCHGCFQFEATRVGEFIPCPRCKMPMPIQRWSALLPQLRDLIVESIGNWTGSDSPDDRPTKEPPSIEPAVLFQSFAGLREMVRQGNVRLRYQSHSAKSSNAFNATATAFQRTVSSTLLWVPLLYAPIGAATELGVVVSTVKVSSRTAGFSFGCQHSQSPAMRKGAPSPCTKRQGSFCFPSVIFRYSLSPFLRFSIAETLCYSFPLTLPLSVKFGC